jgi:hypothetical protein
MSMKRMLGMMLASRMPGRGMRGGMGRGMGGGGLGGGGLGGLAAAGMLGGRRGGLGQKAGLAALGYRAYQDHQAHNQGTGAGASGNPVSNAQSGGGHTGGADTGSGIGGAPGGIMQSVSDALGGGSQDVPGARHSTAGPAAAGASPNSRRLRLTRSPSELLLFRLGPSRADLSFAAPPGAGPSLHGAKFPTRSLGSDVPLT